VAGAEAQTRPAFAGLRLLTVVAALAPTPAAAGAWLAPEGGQEIVTNSFGERNETFVVESSTYWEVPNDDKSSIILVPWVETNDDTLEGWRGEATLAYKRVVYRDDRNIVALQGGALWVSHPADCGEGGAEVRVLAGRGFGETGFVNMEIAGRALSGGCEGGRMDVTAGYRPLDNWLALGQVFFDAPVDGDDTVRGQVSLVRFDKDGRGVQVGFRARVDGGAPEPTLVIGLWGQPGD
jgi:hypothetical protein